jgi:hypothetical protein
MACELEWPHPSGTNGASALNEDVCARVCHAERVSGNEPRRTPAVPQAASACVCMSQCSSCVARSKRAQGLTIRQTRPGQPARRTSPPPIRPPVQPQAARGWKRPPRCIATSVLQAGGYMHSSRASMGAGNGTTTTHRPPPLDRCTHTQ